MGNLGWYQLMTSSAKRVGGPKTFMGLLITGGFALGLVAYVGGTAISNRIQQRKNQKKKTEAAAIIYTVNVEGKSNEGLLFKQGDQFKILEKDGDAGLITKLGDYNNPYFVSLRFLSSISNYEFS